MTALRSCDPLVKHMNGPFLAIDMSCSALLKQVSHQLRAVYLAEASEVHLDELAEAR